MKHIISTLLSTAAIAITAPATASAHERDRGRYGQSDWQTERRQYDQFGEQFDHLHEGVEHGLSDGVYTRSEGRQFDRAINDLRRRLDWYRRSDGYLSSQECNDMNRRLDQLHEVMHEAHEDGHEDQGYGDYHRH